MKPAHRFPQKILIIQLRRIGDVLMCTPALRALRKNFPQSHISFLVERESSDLLTLNPQLDEVIVLEKEKYKNPLYSLRKIWQIRKKRYDLVIDFLGNPRSAYFSFFSGAGRRIGYDLPGRRLLYNEIVRKNRQPKYSAVHKMEALKALGIEDPDVRLEFFISEEDELFSRRFFTESGIDRNKLNISISPTSRRHFRRWPLERFALLADWLVSRLGANVILVWGPGEAGVVEKIKSLMIQKPVISPKTENLFQLGAILKSCDLHIGNDNGTKHIAVAVGKPTITIYGPQDPISWSYPDFSRHRYLKKDVDCPDCDKIKHRCTQLDCLEQIGVKDVQEVFLQLLDDLKKNQERDFVKKAEHPAVD
jgi:heptosyltransferase-3